MPLGRHSLGQRWRFKFFFLILLLIKKGGRALVDDYDGRIDAYNNRPQWMLLMVKITNFA